MLELAGRFFSARMFFLNPHDLTHSRWIISKRQLRSSCVHPAIRITESHYVRPARCRGHLPRVTVPSPPAAAENTFINCLFARRSGSPIAMEFGQTMISSSRTVSYVSLCFGEIHFLTDFRLPLWALSHNDPVHAVCWGFSTDELLRCVNWLFTLLELLCELTVHIMLNFVHESSRFSLCSTEHLWIVSPQPRTPTRRRQSIDVYDHDSTCRNRRHRRESTKEVHGLVVRIAPVIFSTPAIVSALDSDWTIYYLLISN